MDVSDLEAHRILEDNKIIPIREKKVEFNVVKYNYNQIDKENTQIPIEERTIKKSGYVVVYTIKSAEEQTVNYIINRNSDAQRVLRMLLNYSGKNEVKKRQPTLESDMFIWLIKRIYYDENYIDLEDGTPPLNIDNLTQFRGQTEDATNRVSANGDTIMKILSTLSFLLESNNMKQIKFSLAYENHENIELVFSRNVIGTQVKNYSGSFEDHRISKLNKQDSDLVIESEIYLLCYLDIIPKLRQAYVEDLDEKNWSSEMHKKFLKKVAKDIQGKIDQRLEQIIQ